MQPCRPKQYTAYEQHYLPVEATYPSALALKLMLGKNPAFTLKDKLLPEDTIIDIGFGDGRDLNLFCDLGLRVYGIELSEKVVAHTQQKFHAAGKQPTLQVGNNIATGFPADFFKVVYSAGAIYYLPDETHSILDAYREAFRICQPDGYFVGSLARHAIHTLTEAQCIAPNVYRLSDPYYQLRQGQIYHAYGNAAEAIADLSTVGFENILLFDWDVNWFGTREVLFLFVCRKPKII